MRFSIWLVFTQFIIFSICSPRLNPSIIDSLKNIEYQSRFIKAISFYKTIYGNTNVPSNYTVNVNAHIASYREAFASDWQDELIGYSLGNTIQVEIRAIPALT